jgi:purine-binding chemotaxis protein CheW
MSRRIVVSGDELQFIVFRLGETEFGIRIDEVERILRYTPPEAWKAGPGFLAGTIGYRGGRVPIVDLRPRAGVRPTFHEETRTMVLAIEELPLAIVVDQVIAALRVDTRTIRPATDSHPLGLRSAGAGTIDRGGHSILVLNAGRLLPAEERQALSEALT